MNAQSTAVLLATVLAAGSPLAAADSTAAASTYAVQARWDLGAASRWDYLDIDPARHRLYLTRGDRVQVLDTASGKVAGEVAGTAGVHGVAFAQDLKLGFTSNGRANSVTAFDLDTLQVKQEAKVAGVNPDAILYEPVTRKLYTFNGKSLDVSVLDPVTLKQTATIAVGGKPEFAVSDAAGKIFVNIEDTAEIVVIDARTDKLLARWPLKGCTDPTGLALDSAHGRLFTVCQNKLMVVTDSKTGHRVAEVAIGEHSDAAAFDAASSTVYASNGDGTLSVVHQLDADHYAAPFQLATVKGARTMALDHATRRVYLPTVVNQVFTVIVAAP
jgi:YVTN family beta-propeller protein